MIIPALLETDPGEIEKKLSLLAPLAKKIHIDFIDQSFSSNTTLPDPSLFKKYEESSVLQAHLMVDEPIKYLERLYESGFKSFVGQIEHMSDQVEFVAKGQELGEVGLGLDLATDLSELKISKEDLDLVLLMCVKAGQSGQQFEDSSIAKIKSLRSESLVNIQVDGGINDQTIKLASEAGANMFTVNSFLFSGNAKDNLEKLQRSIV
jgi:ribulose-phosphate 3-epimerase